MKRYINWLRNNHFIFQGVEPNNLESYTDNVSSYRCFISEENYSPNNEIFYFTIIIMLFNVTDVYSKDWRKAFGDVGDDIGNSVIQLNDSSYIITGLTQSFDAAGENIFLIFLSGINSPKLCFENTYQLFHHDTSSVLPQGSSLKANKYGDSLWMKTYHGYEGISVIHTNDNGFMIAKQSQNGIIIFALFI